MSELPPPPLIGPHAPQNMRMRGHHGDSPYQQQGGGPVLSDRVRNRKPRRAAGALQYIGRQPFVVQSAEAIAVDQESKNSYQVNDGGGQVLSGSVSQELQAVAVAEDAPTEQELLAEKAAIDQESASIKEELEAIDAEKATIEQLKLKNPWDPEIEIRQVNLYNWRSRNGRRGGELGMRRSVYKKNLATLQSRHTKAEKKAPSGGGPVLSGGIRKSTAAVPMSKAKKRSLNIERAALDLVAKNNRVQTHVIEAEKALIAVLKQNDPDDPQIEIRQANLNELKQANSKLSAIVGEQRRLYKQKPEKTGQAELSKKQMKKALARAESDDASLEHGIQDLRMVAQNRPLSIADLRKAATQSGPTNSMVQQNQLDLFTDLSESEQSMQMHFPIPNHTGNDNQLSSYVQQAYAPAPAQSPETLTPAQLGSGYVQGPPLNQATLYNTTFGQPLQNQQVPVQAYFHHNGFQPINAPASNEQFVLPSNIVTKLDAWQKQQKGHELARHPQTEHDDAQCKGPVTTSQVQQTENHLFQVHGKTFTKAIHRENKPKEKDAAEDAANQAAEEAPRQQQSPTKAEASFQESKRAIPQNPDHDMNPDRLPASCDSGPYRVTLQERDARRAEMHRILFTPLNAIPIIDLTDDGPEDAILGPSDIAKTLTIDLTNDGPDDAMMAASDVAQPSTTKVEEQIDTMMDAENYLQASSTQVPEEAFEIIQVTATAAEDDPPSRDASSKPAESLIAAADESLAPIQPEASADTAMGGI